MCKLLHQRVASGVSMSATGMPAVVSMSAVGIVGDSNRYRRNPISSPNQNKQRGISASCICTPSVPRLCDWGDFKISFSRTNEPIALQLVGRCSSGPEEWRP
jgi:hypothetical protein